MYDTYYDEINNHVTISYTYHIDKHHNYISLWFLEYKLLSETHALLIIANPLRNIMKLIKSKRLINEKQPTR